MLVEINCKFCQIACRNIFIICYVFDSMLEDLYALFGNTKAPFIQVNRYAKPGRNFVGFHTDFYLFEINLLFMRVLSANSEVNSNFDIPNCIPISSSKK